MPCEFSKANWMLLNKLLSKGLTQSKALTFQTIEIK